MQYRKDWMGQNSSLLLKWVFKFMRPIITLKLHLNKHYMQGFRSVMNRLTKA